jgi:8-amino-7-oxononanoate synthase
MTAESPLHDWLAQTAIARAQQGLTRELVARPPVDDVLDLAGNDYLGLSREPTVVEAAVDAVRTWGTGATGSRLVTGTTQLHAELEQELAAFTGASEALVFATGYAANLAVVTALGGEGTLLVSDAGNHASLIDGARLARGRVVVTPHRDVSAVCDALAARTEPRALVVTDAVFSVDGDAAPLADLADVCATYGATLVVDEAHALGVVGPGGAGLVAAERLERNVDVIRTVTLSKALGAQGGAVLATPDVVAHLVDTARTFIFDTGLAPSSVAAAIQALRVLRARPELAETVREHASALARGLDRPEPAAAIVGVPVADPRLAVVAMRRCAALGVRLGCFRPPSVPDRCSRLRIAARATLTAAQVQYVVQTVRAAVATAA